MSRIVVIIVILLLTAVVHGQDDASDQFFAYGRDGTLYALTPAGDVTPIQNFIQLNPPISGVRVGDSVVLANVPSLASPYAVFGILRSAVYEPIAITLERDLVIALDAPRVQAPYLLFGAQYRLQDIPAQYVALMNIATGERWQLINEVQACGLECVRITPDGTRVSYPVVNRGLGSTPQTTLRLTDFDTTTGSRTTRFELTVTGPYSFAFAASDDGAWWWITRTNQETNERDVYLIDANGDEQPVPPRTETTRFTFAGNALLSFDVACNAACSLTVYPDGIGAAETYRMPAVAAFGADWHLLDDGALLMVSNREGFILTQDDDPRRLLDGTWAVERVDRDSNTLHLTQRADDRWRLALLDLSHLGLIAEIETAGALSPYLEAAGDWLLLRDRSSAFARVLDRVTGDIYALPDGLLCKELTGDGQVICERGTQIVVYDAITGDERVLADDLTLIDGF